MSCSLTIPISSIGTADEAKMASLRTNEVKWLGLNSSMSLWARAVRCRPVHVCRMEARAAPMR